MLCWWCCRRHFLALASKKTNGEIINIGSGKPIRVKDVIKKICTFIGYGKPQFGQIKYRKDENMKVYAHIKKALLKLKWKPKINLRDGLQDVWSKIRLLNKKK